MVVLVCVPGSHPCQKFVCLGGVSMYIIFLGLHVGLEVLFGVLMLCVGAL